MPGWARRVSRETRAYPYIDATTGTPHGFARYDGRAEVGRRGSPMRESDARSPRETCSDQAQVEVEFSGRVQGVGFRATASSVVTKYTITGYVINLRSGGVRLVAEGSRAVVSKAGNDAL